MGCHQENPLDVAVHAVKAQISRMMTTLSTTGGATGKVGKEKGEETHTVFKEVLGWDK